MEKLFDKFNVIEYIFTDEKSYDKHDGIFLNSRNEYVIFEVKNRNVSSTKYTTTVIEESKYEYLMSQENKVPYIFIFFNDGMYFPHKLEDSNNYKKTQMLAPKTTAGDKTKVMKTFIEIPINKNTLYRYE